MLFRQRVHRLTVYTLFEDTSTEEQIEDYGLPTKPVKSTQSRLKYDIAESVEAEAMPPDALRRIVADAFEPMVDQREMMMMREVEASERHNLRERWMAMFPESEG